MAQTWSEGQTGISRYTTWGIIFSLFVHLALVWLLAKPPLHEVKWESEPINVSFVEPPAPQPQKQQQQIVSPSQAETEPPKVVPDTNFRSEKDSVVPKQQLKRGDSEQAGPRVGEQQRPAPPPPPKTQPRQEPQKAKPPAPAKQPPAEKAKHLPSLQDLAASEGELMQKFRNDTPEQADPSKAQTKSRALNDYQAFTRPSGSGAAFVGLQGSSDFLPNLPDGDITLLNAKADRYAVFVRRVATQVFAQLRLVGWDTLMSGDIRAISDFTTVYATLSPQGQLLKVTLEDGSGSSRFDNVVIEASKRGAKDSNPPPGALGDDGNIHFVFKARSWSQVGANRRTGALSERRWLLLATGLL